MEEALRRAQFYENRQSDLLPEPDAAEAAIKQALSKLEPEEPIEQSFDPAPIDPRSIDRRRAVDCAIS